MYGRYGIDQLYYALLVTYIVLLVINAIVDKSTVLSILMCLVIVYAVFRVMSRNHLKRQRENQIYLKLIQPFRTFFTVNYKRLRDIRSKRYRVCKKCHAIIRLPIKKGTHGVICPKCRNKFNVKIRF